MEAASQALPILATAFAGTPEFLSDGIHAMLVPPGDPAALSAALARLCADPTLRLRLGAAARVRLVQDFSEDAAIDLIAEALRASAGLTAPVRTRQPDMAPCGS